MHAFFKQEWDMWVRGWKKTVSGAPAGASAIAWCVLSQALFSPLLKTGWYTELTFAYSVLYDLLEWCWCLDTVSTGGVSAHSAKSLIRGESKPRRLGTCWSARLNNYSTPLRVSPAMFSQLTVSWSVTTLQWTVERQTCVSQVPRSATPPGCPLPTSQSEHATSRIKTGFSLSWYWPSRRIKLFFLTCTQFSHAPTKTEITKLNLKMI